MSNEWDANIQAINAILDRTSAEVARKCEVIEKLSDKVQDRDDTIETLQNQLFERLAEINQKDERILFYENEIILRDRWVKDRNLRILELEGQLATALREREGR